jgi:protocatechuate 3,4-dioxygenase beta subunit
VKFQVAEYLGRIGDNSVLPALKVFAEKWQGLKEENIFQKAIMAIHERQVESEPESLETTNIQESVESQVPLDVDQTKVAGIVIDKNTGRPIQGARVGFRRDESVLTDAGGRFVLTYTKDSEEVYVYASASDYASRRIIVRVKKSGVQDVTFELSSGSKLAGVVMDPNSGPIQGAEVSISGIYVPIWPVTTDSEGRYEIHGLDPLESSCRLYVTHPAYPPVTLNFQPAPVGETLYKEIFLKPGVVIFGQVTDSQGKPVSGVEVGGSTTAGGFNITTYETDEDGMYILDDLANGKLTLWAIHDEHELFVKVTTLKKGPVEQQIDIQLNDPHILQGRVVDDEGKPVPEAIVTMYRYNRVSNLGQNRCLCDSQGRFIIPNAPHGGELELQIFGPGIAVKMHKVDFEQDECLITVDRSGRIYGKVIDAVTGKPITKFLVKIIPAQAFIGIGAVWGEGYTFSSPEGLFDTGREKLSIKGQYRVTVIADGYDPVVVDPVTVQPISENPVRTEFMLKSLTIFAGRVVDIDGHPIEGAKVVFFSEDRFINPENWRRTVTDNAGVFTISGLDSKQNHIFVSSTGFTSNECLISDLLEKDGLLADIVLNRGASLIGRVVDESGKGIADATVRAFVGSSVMGSMRPLPGPGPKHESITQTDKDGYYRLSGVPTGLVQVSVMSAQNSYIGNKLVNLKSGETAELNFDY